MRRLAPALLLVLATSVLGGCGAQTVRESGAAAAARTGRDGDGTDVAQAGRAAGIGKQMMRLHGDRLTWCEDKNR